MDGDMAPTCENLIAGWRACGAVGDVPLIVHSSLSRLGEVYGGAATVVQSLLAVTPTLVVPAFRNAPMGAVSAYVEAVPSALLSSHPVVPVAAVGPDAAAIVRAQPLAFALGAGSPFDVLHSLGGQILLIGVDHTRNSFLHHCEALTPSPRLQKRVMGPELVVDDVAGDYGRFFPVVGREFEEAFGVESRMAGGAECRLLPVRPFREFAVRRLTELLASA
ncbi:AAC(3) family N-acetyltransferase [Lentzea atacamensis]|nr:AAC(3) family N-acetyltransferase [Lentzea atacamensis]